MNYLVNKIESLSVGAWRLRKYWSVWLLARTRSQPFWAKLMLSVVLAGFGSWFVIFLIWGPTLALNHDELNFLHEALQLPVNHRFHNYGRGPLLSEMIVFLELGWYFILRVIGRVHSPDQFLVHVLANLEAHLALCRALAGLIAFWFLIQVYRLGRLFGGALVGATACLLCATNLTFIAFASMCKEEPLFWGLLLAGCYEAWRAADQRSKRSAVLAGVAIGASFAAKLFGIFAIVLFALPFYRLPGKDLKNALKLSLLMVASCGVTVLVLHPFLVTDTTHFLESMQFMHSRAANWPGVTDKLALGPYLFVHLPNLVGSVILLSGLAELILRLAREPRGPVVLVAVPVLLLLFLGLRPGYNMAYYTYPTSIFLCLLAASLVWRVVGMAQLGRLRFLAPVCLLLVVVFDSAFLHGSVKHALVITGPDTRLIARDYITSHAAPGDRITVTNTLGADIFWGPPLTPQDPPDGSGVFAAAQRKFLQQAKGPRYRLQLIDSSQRFAPEMVRDSDWVIIPRFGHSAVELGPADEWVEPPAEFRLVEVIRAQPEHSYFFPYYTSFDYESLRRVSLAQLWSGRTVGWTLSIYQRGAELRKD